VNVFLAILATFSWCFAAHLILERKRQRIQALIATTLKDNFIANLRITEQTYMRRLREHDRAHQASLQYLRDQLSITPEQITKWREVNGQVGDSLDALARNPQRDVIVQLWKDPAVEPWIPYADRDEKQMQAETDRHYREALENLERQIRAVMHPAPAPIYPHQEDLTK
jgi:hypothetical protein